MGKAPPDEIAAWDRRQGESRPAFEAFVVYRDMGSERSITGAAARVSKHWTLLARWSTRHDWVVRVTAWDAHLDAINQRAQENERIAMSKRHAQLALGMQAKAAEKLKALKPNSLRPGDVVKMAVEGAKLERLARGEPDTITAVTGRGGGPVEHAIVPGVDLTGYTDEELKALREIYEAAHARRDQPGTG